ncbi:hypothetical protein AciM339_0450 [Aciduliprofundum sp. MAR08-339]|nr:hypothetical protein AciM339_0450 [Aciduliprofundum sp. MAR08-339]
MIAKATYIEIQEDGRDGYMVPLLGRAFLCSGGFTKVALARALLVFMNQSFRIIS